MREKYFKDNSGCDRSSIRIWKSKGLSNQSLSFSGGSGGADDIKMSKPIRPAYIIFCTKKKKTRINSKHLHSI